MLGLRGGVARLALHAGPADPGDGRPGRRRASSTDGPFGIALLRPAGAVRPRRPGPGQPRRGLEPRRQHRPRGAVRPPRPPGQSRAAAGRAVRRRRPAAAAWASCGAARPRVAALRGLLIRFLGQERADTVFAVDLRRRGRVLAPDAAADAALVQLAERQLARAIGSASARVMVGSVVRGEVVGPDDLMQILDETSQAIEYSQRLEQKSRRSSRRRPSCARPTSGCASSTSSRTTSSPPSATSCARP